VVWIAPELQSSREQWTKPLDGPSSIWRFFMASLQAPCLRPRSRHSTSSATPRVFDCVRRGATVGGGHIAQSPTRTRRRFQALDGGFATEGQGKVSEKACMASSFFSMLSTRRNCVRVRSRL
jgi:hypothetical protein